MTEPAEGRRRRRLPRVLYNPTSAIGAFVAVSTFSVIVLLYLIDLVVQRTTVYLGLLTFVLLPIVLIAGIALIVVGAIAEWRRLHRGAPRAFSGLIRIDLRKYTERNALLAATVGFALFLMGTSVGTYKAYQATESNEFCGQLCHEVMHPEFTAYQTSPHARVHCVECHIGPGADWFVKSKITGAYQLYAVLANVYPKPIETPISNLRPARETCEQCHWPEQFFGARENVNPHFLADEANTPYPITILIRIGGGSEKTGRVEGIHWHMAIENKLEYIARDHDRHDIAWIRSTDLDGNVKVFENTANPLSEEERAEAEIRTLDCIDCHNRPSHIYRPPARAVNEAIAAHWIDRSLPYIKREAVTLLEAAYEDTPAALQAIQSHLIRFYEQKYPEIMETRRSDVDSSIAGVKRVFQQNVFPEMNVSWRAYPDNIGHVQSIGCFRCHGDQMQTQDGEKITRDCTVCHAILSQGSSPKPVVYSPKGIPFEHPVDIGGMEREMNCSDCHDGSV